MSNILIIKHGSLGDIAQASGAIQDIFENHKNDKLYLLTTKSYFDLFKKNPFITDVILDKRLSRFNLIYLYYLMRSVKKLDIQKGKKVEFKKVLLLNDDKTTEIGNPIISGAIVEGLLLDNIKDKKILVFKKRRRQNSRKKYGHRQPLSKIQITKILSKNGKVISEIKENKSKLSTEPKLDKKLSPKKEKTVEKTTKKKKVLKTKSKK